ncbi:hypothetical protein ACFQ0G_21460 [Streptomyces chiangmaiensis]
MLTAAGVGGLDQLPVLDLAAEGRVGVADVEELAVDARDGAGLVGGLTEGPPEATGPEVSRSVPTARLDRSTFRNCASYQPFWASAFTCWRSIPGPIFSDVLVRGFRL